MTLSRRAHPLKLLLALLLGTGLFAQSDWTKEDTARQWAVTSAITMDVALTWGAPKTNIEANPMLGKHPSHETLIYNWAGAVVGSYLLARILPPRYRHWFQYWLFSVELYLIGHNYGAGCRIRF